MEVILDPNARRTKEANEGADARIPRYGKEVFTARAIEPCNASTEDMMRRGNIILVINDVGQPGP